MNRYLNNYLFSKENALIVLLIIFPQLNGCATQMLHYKINGYEKPVYPEIEYRDFLISKIDHAEIEADNYSKVLSVCVTATYKNRGVNSEENITDEYELTIPLEGVNAGVKNAKKISKNCVADSTSLQKKLSVDIVDESTVAFMPSPGEGGATSFIMSYISPAGSLGYIVLPKKTDRPNKFFYIANNHTGLGTVENTIIIKPETKVHAVQVQQKVFTSKDLLAVFYPLTVVWDIVTLPLQLVLLYLFPPA